MNFKKGNVLERHASDSFEQQHAEAVMRGLLEEKLHLSFDKETKLSIDIDVRPDAIDQNNKVIVETRFAN